MPRSYRAFSELLILGGRDSRIRRLGDRTRIRIPVRKSGGRSTPRLHRPCGRVLSRVVFEEHIDVHV